MGYLIIAALVIALYVMYIYLLFYISMYLFPVGCIAFIGVVLYNYLRSMWINLFGGTGWEDSPHGPEPAFRQYFFRKAYYDYQLIVQESWPPNRSAADWIIDLGKKLFSNDGVLFTWPLGITFFAIAAAGAAAAAAAYLALGLLHLLLVLSCAALAFSLALFIRSVEYGSMVWRHIFLACPNGDCYGKINLPIYICPTCGVEHRKLIPGSYGIFKRRCKCGATLVTLFLFGRNSLPCICPHCRKPLNTTLGTIRNIHIPIVGGPAAGKTSFLMANMCELHRRSEHGEFDLEFPAKKHQALFERSHHNFLKGTLMAKTAEESPDAFEVALRDSRGHERLLYVYDAAGELYQQTDILRRHNYYEYTHGILFLLDPFSLPQLQTDYASSLAEASDQIKPCAERPQDVYDRMVGAIRQFSRAGHHFHIIGAIRQFLKTGRRFSSIPVAVVVTKVDAFNLEKTLQPLSDVTVLSRSQSKDDIESQAVRQWLITHGEGNLVRSIEHDFNNVRYFYCSALGRLPDSRLAPFAPTKVLEPLAWVFNDYGLRIEIE